MNDEIIIKKLEKAGEDQVSLFRMSDSEDKPLVQFIRRTAKKSAAANLTQTYVIKESGSPCVLAYISLMCAEIRLDKQYEIDDKVGANRYEYQPAVRIARLAVCDVCQKKGWGRKLVEFVIGIVLISIQPHAGCRFLILDAKRKSVGFYKKLGFRLLETEANKTDENPLMFMDLKSVSESVEA
ncbi:unnamed protein product [Ectocarpus sp. 12 AP-2014]